MHLIKAAGNTNIKIKINKINFGLKVSKKGRMNKLAF